MTNKTRAFAQTIRIKAVYVLKSNTFKEFVFLLCINFIDNQMKLEPIKPAR
jgi:hypothetical protein